MKTYRIEKHQVYADDKDFVADMAVEDANGNWVPADVAQGLYDALEMVLAVHYGGESQGRQASCPVYAHARAALTAADGDGGDDD